MTDRVDDASVRPTMEGKFDVQALAQDDVLGDRGPSR